VQRAGCSARVGAMRRRSRTRLAALLIGSAALLLSPPASAHDRKVIGPLRLSIGWGNEPAFTGAANFVEVAVTDLAGTAVSQVRGSLSVEVSFGGERIVLPLVPAGGELRAPLVPTRPGTYTFHLTGTLRGRAVDTTSTCSDTTFACVTDVAEAQFPVKDPSNGQLEERLTRALPRAEHARGTAKTARNLAVAALVVAGVALAAGLVSALRRR
jgi:hypothetical protein